MTHTHRCIGCGRPFSCTGQIDPALRCLSFETYGLRTCEDCFVKEQRELSDDEATEALTQAAQKAAGK